MLQWRLLMGGPLQWLLAEATRPRVAPDTLTSTHGLRTHVVHGMGCGPHAWLECWQAKGGSVP